MLTYAESLTDLRSEKKHLSRTPANAPHLPSCIFSANHAHELTMVNHFAANHQVSDVLKKQFANSHFIIAQSFSALDTSAAMLHLHLRRFVSLLMTHFYSTSSTHNAVTKDIHPQMWHLMVTLLLPCKRLFSCIQHTSYTEAMLCVKWQDPDGGHLVRTDGLPRWLQTGYAQANTYSHTHTQMATRRVWPGDGRTVYWFAQINDFQPGHLKTGELHPQSWHSGLARWHTQSKVSLGPIKWIWVAFKPFLIILI